MRKLVVLLGAATIAMLVCTAAPALAADTPVRCSGTRTGVTINRDVVVPPGKPCTLIDSVINGGVSVQSGSYFQASNTSISKAVVASQSQTVFIDTGSQVGARISTDQTAQVFVFNATVNGSIGVSRSSSKVQICGTTVNGPAVSVSQSGSDILVGDPLADGCPGNTVTNGSVALVQNATNVEFVVRGNSVPNGNLTVQGNVGPSSKYVQSNAGGKTLKCTGNSGNFVGGPNGSWVSKQGQCF